MLSHTPLTLDDFAYELPPELIAQHPAAERGGSRLLCLAGESLADRMFADLPQLFAPGDLLVFNDTRVIKARLYGQKASGGRIELLIERVLGDHEALAHIRASHAPDWLLPPPPTLRPRLSEEGNSCWPDHPFVLP